MSELIYPLAIPVKAGLELINKYKLRSETSLRDHVDDYLEYADVLFSAHAPIEIDGQRLNVASIDRDFREYSIDVIKTYIDKCAMFPNLTQLNLHFGYKRWFAEAQIQGRIGDYENHIMAIRDIADYASEYEIEIVMENLNSYWSANQILPETDPLEIDWSDKSEPFATYPDEWISMCEDINNSNVKLCLDTSHICTYAQRFPKEDRKKEIMKFLSRPDLINHVHWSDNYLYDIRGRNDSHLAVGSGTIPADFHKAVKSLDATILLEHYYSENQLIQELEFIDKL
ncbi:MAG: TIM barrel protein [SAR202 cluster bacterium]|nr:hypothetical protein [Chloroflexota bacterium]MQG22222.1 TIM barrel protein [SAR202 cluster bacterium]|tara:strand:- start:673 stop:1527 length:855 start_codon:yes stop_codon:yes gene_type:complete